MTQDNAAEQTPALPEWMEEILERIGTGTHFYNDAEDMPTVIARLPIAKPAKGAPIRYEFSAFDVNRECLIARLWFSIHDNPVTLVQNRDNFEEFTLEYNTNPYEFELFLDPFDPAARHALERLTYLDELRLLVFQPDNTPVVAMALKWSPEYQTATSWLLKTLEGREPGDFEGMVKHLQERLPLHSRW